MAIHAPITGAPIRAPIFARFGLFNRADIEQEIERLIALIDEADGDCDFEATNLEDDFVTHNADGPGCPIADIDRCGAQDDDPAKLIGDYRGGDPDDAEDDDPSGDCLDRGEGEGDMGMAC